MYGIFYFIIIESFSRLSEHQGAFLISFLILIGNALFPIWLYQGLEKMKYITYINIIVKTLVTLLIFIFIKSKNDLNLSVFFQTLYYFIPVVISLFLVDIKFNLRYKLVLDLRKIIYELKRGKHVFLTNLWINFYSQGPIVILGFLTGNNATGNYGIGQKIQGAFSGLVQPLTQAVYPYLCDLFENRKKSFFLFKKKLLILVTLFSICISILLCILAPYIIDIVSGTVNDSNILLIRLFSFIVFLSIMNTLMARIMYAMNLSKTLNKSYSVAAIIFMVLSVPVTLWLQEFGMVIVVIISQCAIFVLNYRNIFTAKEQIKKI